MEALSKTELLALLAAARASRERDWLLILVTFWHGLRVSEVISFKRDAVKDGYLTIDRLKGSLRTTQALVEHPEPLLSERAPLIEYARKTRFDVPVFNIGRKQVWRLVRRYGAEAGIPEHKLHPHVLKHTCAMQMIDKAGIHKTRQRLGHKSISSTGAYLVESDADVDAVMVSATGL